VFQQGIAVTKPSADSTAGTNLGDAVPGQRAGVKDIAALLLQSAFGLAGQKQEPRVELFIGQWRLGSRSRVATLRRPPHFYRFPTVGKIRRIGRNERPSTPAGLKMVAVLSLAPIGVFVVWIHVGSAQDHSLRSGFSVSMLGALLGQITGGRCLLGNHLRQTLIAKPAVARDRGLLKAHATHAVRQCIW
jgi:hypothetical protein